MKVVINNCFGGFSISKECAEHMAKNGSKQAQAEIDEWEKDNEEIKHFLKTGKWRVKDHGFLEIDAKYHKEPTFHGYGYSGDFDGYSRNDPHLIEAVENLGEKANGECAELKVIEIPDGTDFEISEYDGNEHIAEKHKTWS